MFSRYVSVFRSRLAAPPANRLWLWRSDKFIRTSAKLYALPATAPFDYDANILAPPGGEIIFPRDVTLVELVRSKIGPWAQQTAYECAVSGIHFTHEEIFKYSRNFAAALYQAGFRRGDVVGLLHANSPIFPIAFYGMLEAGIVVNLLNPLLPPDRIAGMILETNTKGVITSSDWVAPILQIKDGLRGNKLRLVVSTGSDSPPAGSHSFWEMLKVQDYGAPLLQGREVNFDEDVAVIFWSGGTTGPPKPVMHTHGSALCQAIECLHPSINVYDVGTDINLATAPLYHAYGNIMVLRVSSLVGAKVITFPKFSPELFAKCVREHKPTVSGMSPRLIDFCGSHESIRVQDFARLRTVSSGGASISPAVRERFLDKFDNKIFLQNLYGMSEAGLINCVPVTHVNQKLGSFGQLIPNTYGKIVDADGNSLGVGQVGELLMKGPQYMKGYMNKPEATRESLDSDGWLHTGDMCYYDEDGFFYITDRIKELIKVNGLQVSPYVLESCLNAHPKIRESVVFGIPDEKSGEVPRAFVVASDPHLTEREIQEFVKDKLAKYEQLTGGIMFVDELPKDPIGKIRRNELKNM